MTINTDNDELIECKFCYRLTGSYTRHLPPECFSKVILYPKSETNPLPGVEDVLRKSI